MNCVELRVGCWKLDVGRDCGKSGEELGEQIGEVLRGRSEVRGVRGNCDCGTASWTLDIGRGTGLEKL